MDKTTEQTQIDARAFRKCLGQFATGVTVITTEVDGKRYGVTANSFASVSIDPPLILWSIGRNSRSFDAFTKTDNFAIHILASDQIDISQRFSSSVADKFEGLDAPGGVAGSPILNGALGVLQCVVHELIDAGDHVILVGRVQQLEQAEGEPLVFAQGRYGLAVDHPELKASAAAASTEAEPPAEPPFFRLLFNAFHAMSDMFDDYRRAEGISTVELRVLVGITDHPGLTKDQLIAQMHLTPRETRDAIAELTEKGQISCDPDGTLWSTADGQQKRKTMQEHVARFEKDLLGGVPDGEIEATRHVLAHVAQEQTVRRG
ncbi:flavin reductase [Marinovum sp.]|uniref:flavin reductase n=1 Tax=Marinovum sp. TaxID=2024839 RepID=UPI003A90189D